jgi:hypothetical protein
MFIKGRWLCQICGRACSSSAELRIHSSSLHMYKCSSCSLSYTKQRYFDNHICLNNNNNNTNINGTPRGVNGSGDTHPHVHESDNDFTAPHCQPLIPPSSSSSSSSSITLMKSSISMKMHANNDINNNHNNNRHNGGNIDDNINDGDDSTDDMSPPRLLSDKAALSLMSCNKAAPTSLPTVAVQPECPIESDVPSPKRVRHHYEDDNELTASDLTLKYEHKGNEFVWWNDDIIMVAFGA